MDVFPTTQTDVMADVKTAVLTLSSQVKEHAPTFALQAALLEAQRVLVNPAKNKSANTGKFVFKFADLPAVLEIVRPALNDAEILLQQLLVEIDGKPTMITRLFHVPSGEWMEMTTSLPRMVDPQEWGKFVSYARRYVLLSAMGIAAGDDDNDAGGKRTRVSDVAPAAILPRVPSAHHQTVLSYAVRALTRAEDFLDLRQALTYWRDHRDDMRWLLEQSRDVAAALEEAIASGVGRLSSKGVANALITALRMNDQPKARMLEQRLSGPWGTEIGRIVQADRQTYDLVQEFLAAEFDRVMPQPVDAPQDDEAVRQIPYDGPTQEIAPSAEPLPSVTVTVQGRPFQVLDQHGDVTEEPTHDPVVYITSYMNILADIDDPTDRENMELHNGPMIEAAIRQSPQAAKLHAGLLQQLRDEQVDPETLRVAPVTDGNGKLLVAAYLAEISKSLATVGPGAIGAWLEVNQQVYSSHPTSVRNLVLARVIKRREELGLPPLASDA